MAAPPRRAPKKPAREGGRAPAGPGRPETGAPASPPPAPDVVFPDDAEAGRGGGRMSLPSSGLAADILALAEAADLEPASAAAPSTEMTTSPAAPAVPRAHNISFFAAPVREERKAAEATEHLATFLLGREEYGVDVRLVQEIIRVPDVTQVPRAPEYIEGVINLRGRIIPVVDLRRKLRLGRVERGRHARIVVVKLRDRLIGLLVDAASQVLKVPVSSIEPAPEEVVEIDAHAIRGVAKLADRLIILMDLARVLSVELREGAEE